MVISPVIYFLWFKVYKFTFPITTFVIITALLSKKGGKIVYFFILHHDALKADTLAASDLVNTSTAPIACPERRGFRSLLWWLCIISPIRQESGVQFNWQENLGPVFGSKLEQIFKYFILIFLSISSKFSGKFWDKNLWQLNWLPATPSTIH